MPKPASDVLERYFDNRSSPEEAKRVVEWLATHEGQLFYEKYLTRRINEQDTTTDHPLIRDQQKTLKEIYDKIHRRERQTNRTYTWYWAAAVVLLLLSTWAVFYQTQSGQQRIATAYGETQKIALSDGTHVMLNAHSTLSYQSNEPREVWLQGEAFFEVFHTTDDAPFKVHTADLTVNVLGTEFNVNTRHKKTDVVLRDGKVRLELEKRPTHDLIMQPGDKVSYAHQKNTLEKKVVAPHTYTSWTSGTIVFDHTPLREVFQWMKDTYGVTIEVNDPAIQSKEFTGEVAQDLEVIMTLLQKSFGLEVSKQGDTIYLNQ